MPTTHTKLHVSCTIGSGTESNEPIPIQVVHLSPYNEDAAVQHESYEASTATVHTSRRKIGLKKSLHQGKMCLPLQLGEQAARLELTLLAQLQIPEVKSNYC